MKRLTRDGVELVSCIAVVIVLMVVGVVLINLHPPATQAGSSDPTDAMDGSKDLADFMDNAQVGFMQLVTIPIFEGMNGPLDPEGYMVVDVTRPQVGYDTFAVSQLAFDQRTGVGCYELWRSDYGQAFCVSGPDMVKLFQHGAYFLAYRTY